MWNFLYSCLFSEYPIHSYFKSIAKVFHFYTSIYNNGKYMEFVTFIFKILIYPELWSINNPQTWHRAAKVYSLSVPTIMALPKSTFVALRQNSTMFLIHGTHPTHIRGTFNLIVDFSFFFRFILLFY